jgi:DNA-binding response OmpR family regulator
MLFGKRKRRVKRVLIIEDEPLTAFDTEMIIQDAGYVVVATHDDFESALETMENEKVHLILSDVRLRGERTGIDIAAEADRLGIPLLFVTGHPPDNVHELAVGALLKPYNEKTMRAALAAVEKHCAGEACKAPRGLSLYPLRRDPVIIGEDEEG